MSIFLPTHFSKNLLTEHFKVGYLPKKWISGKNYFGIENNVKFWIRARYIFCQNIHFSGRYHTLKFLLSGFRKMGGQEYQNFVFWVMHKNMVPKFPNFLHFLVIKSEIISVTSTTITFSYFIFGWICWTLSGVKLDFSKIGDLISSSSSSGIGFGEL